jgi:probable phosphoglycerate mutase
MEGGFFAELDKPVEFYFVRHGQSEGNIAGILQGRLDYPLTALGRKQAALRGRSLRDLLAGGGLTLLYVSPLGRAAETARIIAAELAAEPSVPLPPPEFLEDLQELDLGSWTGKTMAEMRQADTEQWKRFQAQSWDAVPGSESAAALYGRALRVWTHIRGGAKMRAADRVLVVTHYGIIQWMIKTSFGVHTWFPLIPIANCGLSKLRVEPIPGQINAYTAWDMINREL